jgi:hypothetical protein
MEVVILEISNNNLNINTMAETNTPCDPNDLLIKVSAKRTPLFKAGSELSKTVNRVDFNIEQEELTDSETIVFDVRLWNEKCPEEPAP